MLLILFRHISPVESYEMTQRFVSFSIVLQFSLLVLWQRPMITYPV